MIAGGMAITKLKAIEEALSVIPTVFTWPKKNFTTSNKGIPLNPGSDDTLLFRTIYVAGCEEVRLFFSLIKKDMLFGIGLFK